MACAVTLYSTGEEDRTSRHKCWQTRQKEAARQTWIGLPRRHIRR